MNIAHTTECNDDEAKLDGRQEWRDDDEGRRNQNYVGEE